MLVVALWLVVSGSVAMSAPAKAYPPPTTKPVTSSPFVGAPGAPGSDSAHLQQVLRGSTQTYTVADCAPGATATFLVNGIGEGTLTADATGAVTFAVTFGTQSISINGGPAVPETATDNTVSISCLGPKGQTIRHTAHFQIVDKLGPTTVPGGGPGGGGNGNGGGLAFTGLEVGAMVFVAGSLLIGGSVLLILGSVRSRRNQTRR
jgi:hypothetical protein